MGAITRSIANNITTSGVFTSGAITNSSVTGITVLPNASDGITFISSQTASASASLSFTSGLDSTYKAYKFVFSNISRGAGGAYLRINFSTDGGSNYNVTKTSSAFLAYHDEGDTSTSLAYEGGGVDLAQETGDQIISYDQSTDADSASNGSLTLFNPSSTVYVKHFISRSNSASGGIGFYYSSDLNVGGYCNTTSAINAVRFRMSTGNISSGTIYMYGIK
jgi:hypothetical protein